MSDKTTDFNWSFQRLGGLDQVILANGRDIGHLGSLDPKLWVALSCPSSGLEFDERTLALLDTDRDGRIRIPEVVAAVEWVCARLKNPDGIVAMAAALPLDDIETETEEGQRLLSTARTMLGSIGKEAARELTQEDVAQAVAHAAGNLFNGDGILPPAAQFDDDVRQFIQDALDVMGGVTDAGGEVGINQAIADAFMATLTGWQTWHQNLSAAATPLGANTAAAWEALCALREKIDDYFLRSDLAGYAPQAQAALNVGEEYLVPSENGLLSSEALAELPLSKIEPGRPLDLRTGLNPVWRDKVERFAQLVKPLLANAEWLTREEWSALQQALAPYAEAVAQKPAPSAVEASVEPVAPVEQIGEERVEKWLQGDAAKRFAYLVEQDAATPATTADIAAVEKLVLFHRYLYRFLINFVSFHDFYDKDTTAAFQAGTLYIDGRSCRLCIPVTDIAKHSVLADYAKLYLLYCECSRRNPAAVGDKESRTIVAAMTAGDADLLLENRNGVFIDNDGNDWDATVVKIISNPISLRQAVWQPYKRFGRMVSEQVNKWAGSKDGDLTAAGGEKLQALTAAPATPEAPPKFDIGKNVGILAAVGLAIGAIGTALASIARSLFELQWWQFPLVILGLFLLISGPSVVMAWLKLRKRTLGPLLEASGWAINGEVKINFMLGRQLTSTAQLPENATRSYVDPLQKKRNWPMIVFVCAILIGAAAAGGWYWWRASAHSAPSPEPAAQVDKQPTPSPAP